MDQSARGVATKAILQAVSSGKFQPGEKLNEANLAATLDVSRNTLREAFATLTVRGIVTRIPHRGVFIASPGVPEIHDFYTARSLLEPAALLWGEDLDIAALDQIVSTAEAHLAAGETALVADTNQEFHRAIVTGAGSAILDTTMEQVLAQMRLVFLTVTRRHPEFHSDYVAVNRQIVAQLQAGDRAAAAAQLQQSLLATREKLSTLPLDRRLH